MSRGSVLVTGAGGLVGRVLVDRLIEDGYSVMPVVKRIDSSSPTGAFAVDLSQGYLELINSMQDIPNVIVHLAAVVPHSPANPDTEDNASTTRKIDETVFEFCSRHNVIPVYASGCGLYDPTDSSVKNEDYPLLARTPYLREKKNGEKLFSDLHSTSILRISAPYGPGLYRSVVMGRFMDRARHNKDLEVWGSGKREQDFIHTYDIAEFIVRVIDAGARGTYNVCHGQAITMKELAEKVVSIAGTGKVVMLDKIDAQEGFTARYDNTRAKNELGWIPKVTLDQGLKTLVNDL